MCVASCGWDLARSSPLAAPTPFSIFIAGLKYLVRLCTDMDLPEAQEYAIALKKAESNLERRESVRGGALVVVCGARFLALL